jgi:hypothetical protein
MLGKSKLFIRQVSGFVGSVSECSFCVARNFLRLALGFLVKSFGSKS